MRGAFEPPSFARAVANGAVIGLGRAYFLGLRALFVFLLVPLIGIEAYGQFVLAQSWFLLILPLSLWGSSELAIRGYLRCPPEEQAAFLGTGLTLRFLLGGGAMLAVLLAARLLEPGSEQRILIYVYATAVLSRGMLSWLGSLFTAHGASASWVRISIAFASLDVVLVLLAAGAGAGLKSISFMQAAVWAMNALVAYVYFAARYVAVEPAWHPVFARHFLRDGARVGLASFLLLSLIPGLLLLYRYFDPAPAALGAVALVLQIFLLAQQVLTVVMNALLASLGAGRELEAAGAGFFFAGGLRVAIFAGGAGSLGVLAVCTVLTSLFSDSLFVPALGLLAEFSWIFVPVLLVQCCRLVILATGAFPIYLWGVFAGAVVAPLGLLLFTSLGGVSEPAVLAAMGLGVSTMGLILGAYGFSAFSLASISLRSVYIVALALALLVAYYVVQPGPTVLMVLFVAFAACAWRDSMALLSGMGQFQHSQT